MIQTIKRVALAGVAAGAIGVAGFAGTAGATVSGVTASQTANLFNGQSINITFTAANVPVQGFLCSATNSGAAFDPTTDCSPDSQFPLGLGGSGVTRPFQVQLDVLDPITCGPSNPCRILVAEGNGLSTLNTPYVFVSNGTPCPGNPNNSCVTFTDAPPPTTTTIPATTTTRPATTTTLPATTTTIAATTTTTGTGPTTTTPGGPPPVVPDAPYAVLLPLVSIAVLGGALVIVRNRRSAA